MSPRLGLPSPIRDLLEKRSDGLTLDDAGGLLRLAVQRFSEGDRAEMHRLVELYLAGAPVPAVDAGKAQAIARELSGRPMMSIHCGPPQGADASTRFARDTFGLALGDPIEERVHGSFAEWYTGLTEREIVWVLAATTPSLLYLDVRWRDAPPDPATRQRRRYIGSARVVDLEVPEELPVWHLTTSGPPVNAELSEAEPLVPESPETTFARYLARHSRIRAGAQQPIDRCGE